jgi:hypothetical protein
MWYLGSLGDAEKMRLTIGAARARPGGEWSAMGWFQVTFSQLTFGFASSLVDTGAHNHDIVDDGKTTLAANPLAILAQYVAVGQHGCLVHDNLPLVELLSIGQFILVEEVPCGTVDDLIWCVAENVDDRVGRVEDMRLGGKIWANDQQSSVREA